MTFLFWLSLVVGGGLLGISLIGDAAGEGDGPDSGGEGDWGRIFSLRNATYFLFAFGATGVLLQLLWEGRNTALAFGIAGATGVIAWMLSAFAFSYLRRTDSGQNRGDRWIVGRTGDVTIPIRAGTTGKIVVTHSGQTQELLALPHAEVGTDPETWRTVMVVEVRDGIALVTPAPELTDPNPQEE